MTFEHIAHNSIGYSERVEGESYKSEQNYLYIARPNGATLIDDNRNKTKKGMEYIRVVAPKSF